MRPAHHRLFVVAGEASGDQLGAEAVRELRKIDPDVEVRGLGGAAMAAEGTTLIADASDVSIVGIFEVVRSLRRISRVFHRIVAEVLRWKPDAVLLIDLPDFNLRLAKSLRPLAIPLLYYVSPQVWAWRAGRIRTIARRIDHMMVIFPFEEALYRRAGVPVSFVGHPLLDRMAAIPARRSEPTAGTDPRVALLPGSRVGELQAHLPVMLEVARQLVARRPGARFILPRASTIRQEELEKFLSDAQISIEITEGKSLEVLRTADVALVASGTATLEAALAGTPMVVVYRVSWLTYVLARLLIRGISSIAMVNIVAGRRLVPEHVQRLDPKALTAALLELLEDAGLRARMQAGYAEVAQRLGHTGASARVARILLDHMDGCVSPVTGPIATERG